MKLHLPQQRLFKPMVVELDGKSLAVAMAPNDPSILTATRFGHQPLKLRLARPNRWSLPGPAHETPRSV